MIVDCHVHMQWKNMGGIENAEDILRAMDEVGIDKIFLFSPPPVEFELQNKYVVWKKSQKRQRESMEKVAEVVTRNSERLIGFAWIDPCLPHAENEVERAIADYKLRGIKMIPDHWYPYEERIFPVYAKIQELKVPILFHSGISFSDTDSSRFCRPTFYEVLLHFPKIKFALAHISWPWTDECIATAGRFRAAVEEANRFRGALEKKGPLQQESIPKKESQMFIDITPGTPKIYRTEALHKAMVYLGEGTLIYGSDGSTTPEGMIYLKEVLERDKKILSEELGLSKEAQDKIMGKNAMALLEE